MCHEGGDSTFVITNNHFEGKAIVNALQLIRLLSGAKVKVPEPLRQHYPELDRIANRASRGAAAVSEVRRSCNARSSASKGLLNRDCWMANDFPNLVG